jgi:hypothetical protein
MTSGRVRNIMWLCFVAGRCFRCFEAFWIPFRAPFVMVLGAKLATGVPFSAFGEQRGNRGSPGEAQGVILSSLVGFWLPPGVPFWSLFGARCAKGPQFFILGGLFFVIALGSQF